MKRSIVLAALSALFVFTLAGWTNQYQKCSKDSDCSGGEKCDFGYCVQR